MNASTVETALVLLTGDEKGGAGVEGGETRTLVHTRPQSKRAHKTRGEEARAVWHDAAVWGALQSALTRIHDNAAAPLPNLDRCFSPTVFFFPPRALDSPRLPPRPAAPSP